MTGIEAGKQVMADTIAKFEKAGFTDSRIARELALVAFADMADFVQVDEQGSVKPIAIADLKKHSKAIKKIREKRRILNGKDEDTILEDTFEFELHSKLEALQMAMEVKGMKRLKFEHDVSESVMAEVVSVLGGKK